MVYVHMMCSYDVLHITFSSHFYFSIYSFVFRGTSVAVNHDVSVIVPSAVILVSPVITSHSSWSVMMRTSSPKSTRY